MFLVRFLSLAAVTGAIWAPETRGETLQRNHDTGPSPGYFGPTGGGGGGEPVGGGAEELKPGGKRDELLLE